MGKRKNQQRTLSKGGENCTRSFIKEIGKEEKIQPKLNKHAEPRHGGEDTTETEQTCRINSHYGSGPRIKESEG